MNTWHINRTLIGILALGLWPVFAQADVAEDMTRAQSYYEKQELTDAILVFKRLAEQNHTPAQARLAEILDYTEADDEAVGWYITAAAQGDADGAAGLGGMYLKGEGIKKNPAQAFHWIKFAAEKDNLTAIVLLLNAYRHGEKSGLAVPLDLQQAQFWEAKSIPLLAAKKKADEEKLAAYKKAAEEKAAQKKAAE